PRSRASGPARPRRRPATGARREGLPGSHVLPGRGPRRRHGVPRSPAAGEHEQRGLPVGPGARGLAGRAAGRALKPFSNEPHAELRRAPVREALTTALRDLDTKLPWRVPVLIGADRGPVE